MASRAALAFDREASGYDAGFGRNPVGLLFRHVFQERLRALFPSGSRVLDLGCGTGEDALFLASLGVSVRALDPAPGMIERARAKAAARGIPESRLRFELRGAEDVGGTGRDFAGAYSNFGALNCVDLERVGDGLAQALRPGAPVLFSFMGRSPVPAILERALTGRGERRGASDPRVAGMSVPTRYTARVEAEALLGRAFAWEPGFALGVLVPGPPHGEWAQRNPQAFGALAALDRIVRAWPVLRDFGDHIVLVGRRR